jgi:hypothetical protein
MWIFVIALIVLGAQRAVATQLGTLDSAIPHIEFTTSAEAIGGATIEDVVVALRQMTTFPICIELFEYDRQKDVLTLGAALEHLHRLKASGDLPAQDEARLQRYEAMAASEPPSAPIGYTKHTFKLVENHITVRTLLNRIVELDPSYSWKNEGTDQNPIVVIQPRAKSALDWMVPGICDSTQGRSVSSLFEPGGKLTLAFQAHDITRVEVRPENALPDVQPDLCHDGMSARDVLNKIVKAAGHDYSWSLSGIKGLRWLTFQQK